MENFSLFKALIKFNTKTNVPHSKYKLFEGTQWEELNMGVIADFNLFR